jgi:hypothetical protein
MFGSDYRLAIKTFIEFYVSKFCDKFRVITFDKEGSILEIMSSDSLFRISFTVFVLEPRRNSQI